MRERGHSGNAASSIGRELWNGEFSSGVDIASITMQELE
jgi:hypothetical protein